MNIVEYHELENYFNFPKNGSGEWDRTTDLWLMSPTL